MVQEARISVDLPQVRKGREGGDRLASVLLQDVRDGEETHDRLSPPLAVAKESFPGSFRGALILWGCPSGLRRLDP